MKKPKITPVEYAIEGHPGVYIRFISPIGNIPSYWCVMRHLYMNEHSVYFDQGFRFWYWTDGWCWGLGAPVRFKTPTAALADYLKDPHQPPSGKQSSFKRQ